MSDAISDSVAVVIVAAGQGLRAGAGGPKQFRAIGGRSVLARALDAFCNHPAIKAVQPVCNPQSAAEYRQAVQGLPVREAVAGGATRQDSVRAGLEALTDMSPSIVLVHDAARPFVTHDVITRAIAAAKSAGGAIPVIAVTDTVKLVDDTGNVVATPSRAHLRIAQTPQSFRYDLLLAAHRRAAAEGRHDFTDDAALVEWAGLTVATFEGDPANMKLTTAEDFAREEARMAAALADVRVGQGFDVHAFGDGDHVMICGVRVAHERGLVGHSDADAGLHALVDALLGAIAEGDIGVHFPPSDPRWRGAASDQFLRHAAERVRGRGGVIAHVDVTVICEAPRIGPHREAMRERIAAIAGIPLASVSVKATTTERLGFTGRGEGVAAMASATVRLPAGHAGGRA
jgi:2-C-methyl-D-erythritol 4-phosphate cytidylyltransferase/2-C-methyl-D-erythritol 2,4-cyclodiphosphate synthase